MRILENIEPKNVFHFFEEICAIPHGSGNTKGISDYCVRFAEERGLRYHQDAANNVIIWKNASPGAENAEPVILQGHIDMVCDKEDGVEFDFTKDGIKLLVEGDFVTADGTTLGGDDGAAVAIMLAVLDDDSIVCPPIEAVFTTDEEVGMLGAAELDFSLFKAKKMLNLDGEKDDEFVAGCAGGVRVSAEIPLDFEEYEGIKYELIVDGLKGGHSGGAPRRGLANASELMGRVLKEIMDNTDVRLAFILGGHKDNVVPAKTTAEIVVNTEKAGIVEKIAIDMTKILKNEFIAADPDIKISAVKLGEGIFSAADKSSTEKAVNVLFLLPNGLQTMSMEVPGLVQTSLNIGILSLDEHVLRFSSAVRSSKASQKQLLVKKIETIVKIMGGTTSLSGDYPAWEYKVNSPFRDMLVDIRDEIFGGRSKVSAIHAGLECGMFSSNIEGLDCVSFGPNIYDAHSPKEKMSISSMQKLWLYMTEVLKRLAQQ